MNKGMLYHARAMIPLCLCLMLFNILYALANLPYPFLFGIVLACWWREGILRIFRGMPGGETMGLALKGLAMALFWPIVS